jgi:hypothetical protein
MNVQLAVVIYSQADIGKTSQRPQLAYGADATPAPEHMLWTEFSALTENPLKSKLTLRYVGDIPQRDGQ